MKKVIFVAAVLTVVVFAFGVIAAQPAHAAEVWNAAVGTIEKIDAAAKTLEVKTMVKAPKMPAVEKMMIFATDNKTKIFKLVEERKEKKLSFTDLKTGQTLWITYKVEAGKNIAKTIEVR